MKQESIKTMIEGGLSMLVANYILDTTNNNIEDDGENRILYLETPYIFNNGGTLCLVEAIYLSKSMELSIRLDGIAEEETGSTFVSPSISLLQVLYYQLGLENDEIDNFFKSLAKTGA